MGRPKKIVEEAIEILESGTEVIYTKPEISKLSLDYPSEGLNDMARKINEIIDRLNS